MARIDPFMLKKILDMGILGIFSNDSEGWRIKVPSSGC